MKRVSNQVFFALLATVAVLVAGCSRPLKFSTVLEGGFDPVEAFRKHGYSVQTEVRGEGIRNPEYGYGWQSWCGVLVRTNEPATCEAVAVVVRDELNRAMGATSLDELTARAGRAKSQALTGMLLYNKDAVHGDMHAWLTPTASNAAVAYVIFVREERLK